MCSSSWLSALPLTEHGLPYTRELFKMLCAFDMVGYLCCYHQIVFVESSSQLSMLLDVLAIVFLPLDIMN